MSTDPESQALEAVPQEALDGVNTGSITWANLAKLLVRGQPEPPAPLRPVKLPLPARITEEQILAMKRLLDIFGSVVPTVRRALEPRERAALLEERQVIDTVGGMVESRKDGIRTSVLNHLDVTKESNNGGRPLTDTPTDKDGHYLAEGKDTVSVPESDSVFSWETSRFEPEINLARLKALADDPDVAEITHTDWLAMTEQTRVWNEAKTMAHLKKNPRLLAVLARVAEPAKAPRGALYVRKAR
jgi:hypothetical protein